MALLWQGLHCTSEVPLKLSYVFYKLPYNMHVARKPITTLRHLLTNVKNKDRLEDRQGAVLYKIKCCDCQATYIGETGRNLSTRLTEHKWVTRNGDVNCHIAEHHLQTKHQIDLDSATCITYSTDYYQWLTLESWFTNLEQMPLNCSQQFITSTVQMTYWRTQTKLTMTEWLMSNNLTHNKWLSNCEKKMDRNAPMTFESLFSQ